MILDFIKSLFLGYDYELKKITPEYLLWKKSSMTTSEYARWLRKQVTICQSKISLIKETGKPVSEDLINKYKIIETERAGVEKIIE